MTISIQIGVVDKRARGLVVVYKTYPPRQRAYLIGLMREALDHLGAEEGVHRIDDPLPKEIQ